MLQTTIQAIVFPLFFMIMLLTKPVFASELHRDELFALLELNGKQEHTLSLQEAVRTALQHQNGIVERAKIEFSDGQISYQVEIAQGSEVHLIEVDPKTGSSISRRIAVGETLFNYLTLGMTATDTSNAETLMTHFLYGLSTVKGTVLDIEMEKEDGLTFFEVKSLNDSKLTVTLISGQTGESIFYQNIHGPEKSNAFPRQIVQKLFN